MSDPQLPPDAYYRPLLPEDRDQGDPYIFAPPPGSETAFRYYVYTTGDDPVEGMAFPVYGSDDLINWHALGESLRTGRASSHWAPCVHYVAGLEAPYVMLYSRAIGVGEEGHVGHAIRHAVSTTPEGPFEDSGHVLTPDLDFAIDPDVYRGADSSLRVAFAMDFVDDEPYGTGIVEAGISDDLTVLTSPPRVLARPRHDWHLYDASRVMPWKAIPGVDWSTDRVRWHTVEAPVGGIVSPSGRQVYLYSGGCFFGFYAVGALVADAEGVLHDVTDGVAKFVIGPQPEIGFYAPGHCSLLRGPDGTDHLMLHARFGSPTAPRQMCLAPLTWDGDRPVGGAQT